MNVVSSQLPVSLPQRLSGLPAARARPSQSVNLGVPATAARAEIVASQTQTTGQLERLQRYAPANRGGLFLYSVTGADSTPTTGVRVDVRI